MIGERCSGVGTPVPGSPSLTASSPASCAHSSPAPPTSNNTVPTPIHEEEDGDEEEDEVDEPPQAEEPSNHQLRIPSPVKNTNVPRTPPAMKSPSPSPSLGKPTTYQRPPLEVRNGVRYQVLLFRSLLLSRL